MAQRQFRSDDTTSWAHGFGDGSSGSTSSSTIPTIANAGCSGSSGSTTLTIDTASTFANNDLVLIHQTRGTGVGAWELNKIASGGGSTSLTLSYVLCNTYTDSGTSQAQIIQMKQYSSVTVPTSQTWTVPAWDGNKGGVYGFFCSGTTTVTGTLNSSSKGYLGGYDLGGSGDQTGYQGEGHSADRGSRGNGQNGSGGGGGTNGGANGKAGGGGGGYASTGSLGGYNAYCSGGQGGAAVGVAELTTIYFGGGGGTGGNFLNVSDGGEGGGILFIFAKDIVLTGSVTNSGGSGSNSISDNAAGGGGAGGSVLLKCENATLGTNLILASGGGGGGGSGNNHAGGGGSVGRIHIDYKTSYTGSTTPTLSTRQDSTISSIVNTFASFLYNFI